MREQSITRRQFVAAAAGGVAALALPRGAGAARRRGAGSGYATYLSSPDLQPPTMTVSTLTETAPGYLFVTTLTGPGQRGPIIFDNHANVVWFKPSKAAVVIDFRRQVYKGKPVLTWWEGTISKVGTGQGEGVIVDTSYQEVARVKAGNGYFADVHELLLTPQGTALITVYNEVTADLTAVGGPASGNVLDSILQEVDVATGKVLLEWHSLDHIPLTDTYAPVLDPFDYFHINSIDVDLDGNLLVSARNTSAVYKVDRKTGEVLWTLGGRSNDFTMGPNTTFWFQHDARAHSDGTLTIFDDGTGDLSHQARGIRLGVDVPGRQCVLLQERPHPTALAVNAMGDAQVLPGNGMLVGWGTQPYVTEFGPEGDVRFDAMFDGGGWNYRAFRNTWVGEPATKPLIAVTRRGANVTVHASWNGSTETAYWQVSAGPSEGALAPVKTVARTGFETAVPLSGVPKVVAATALDAAHRPLGSSAVRRLAK